MEMVPTIDPTTLLCSLLGYAGREVATHQFTSVENLSSFIEAGWLVPTARPSAVLCEVCDVVHSVDVDDLDGRPQAICVRSGEAFDVAPITQLY
jgi:hypothetical protein